MKTFKRWIVVSIVLAVAAESNVAHAQWAVIDVRAIAQLVQEVATLQQQLATEQQQLQQAQQELQTMTGDRGMEQLLAGTVRNYLPETAADLQAVFNQTSTPYSALAAYMQNAMGLNAVLGVPQIASLGPQQQSQLQAARRAAAALQAIAADALAVTSDRFASLQGLIDAIGRAPDQKAILDLQARIAAEHGMLENEHTKLAVLYQAAVGQQWANTQRDREQVIAGHGTFGARFQPVP